jgi:hypothetical protein
MILKSRPIQTYEKQQQPHQQQNEINKYFPRSAQPFTNSDIKTMADFSSKSANPYAGKAQPIVPISTYSSNSSQSLLRSWLFL